MIEKGGYPQPEADSDQRTDQKERERRDKRERLKKRVGRTFVKRDTERKDERAESTGEEESAKSRPSAFDEVLASLTIRRREESADDGEAGKAKEQAKQSGEKPAEKPAEAVGGEAIPVEAVKADSLPEAGTTKADGKKASAYEESLPNHEPKDGELYAGEAYIDLSDKGLVTLLLHGGTEEKAAPEADRPEESTQYKIRQQPEQQHQSRDEQGVEPEETTVEFEPAAEEEQQAEAEIGGGEEPPIEPPETPRFNVAQPEEPEPSRRRYEAVEDSGGPEPAQIYREYMQREREAASRRAAERNVTEEELDDAVYRATRVGQIKGVFAGLLAGGLYEHYKHKRREKRAEKRAKAQTKELEAARRDYRFNLQTQEQQHAALETRLLATERKATVAERLAGQQLKHPENAPQPPLQPAPEQQAAPGEQLLVPPEHRIAVSAWLSTEIDKKTGKAVENPTFQYGHEYYRERAQEATPAQQRRAAAGSVVITGLTGGGQSPGSSSSLPRVQVPSATMQGAPAKLHVQQGTDTAQSKRPEPSKSATLLWPWLLALAVVAICLIVALH